MRSAHVYSVPMLCAYIACASQINQNQVFTALYFAKQYLNYLPWNDWQSERRARTNTTYAYAVRTMEEMKKKRKNDCDRLAFERLAMQHGPAGTGYKNHCQLEHISFGNSICVLVKYFVFFLLSSDPNKENAQWTQCVLRENLCNLCTFQRCWKNKFVGKVDIVELKQLT